MPSPRSNVAAVTQQPKPSLGSNGSGGGQHIMAPLNAHKPLTYSESDNDDSDGGGNEFGRAEFAAAEALASKNRIVKKGRGDAFNHYPGPSLSLS